MQTQNPQAILAKELTDSELLRYSRQILLEGWDMDAQLRLKNSYVLIIGAGGLGCPVSETLARAGVGNIYLLDDDVIEASNLQRQTLFLTADIGKSKAQTACLALQQINELIHIDYQKIRLTEQNFIQIMTEFNLAGFVSDGLLNKGLLNKELLNDDLLNKNSKYCSQDSPFLLLDCTDNFATRDLINRLSVTYHLPLLSASAIAMSGQLALFEPQKQTGCYHCVFGDVGVELVEDGQQNCANSGVLASTTAVMGNLQANVALQYLGLANNPLSGKLLLWDARSMKQRLIGYQADKQCPICANCP